jgi:hypothetical protein
MTTILRRAILAFLAGTVILSPISRAAGPPARPRPISIQEVWARTELYFGSERPGGVVSKPEFMQFVDYEVTPRFPDGLTVLTGYGQFRNSAGILVKERSRVLILFYPVQTEEANKKIQEIREAYKKAFQQESVLRVDSFSLISF